MTTSHDETHPPVSEEAAREAMQKRRKCTAMAHFGNNRHPPRSHLYNLFSRLVGRVRKGWQSDAIDFLGIIDGMHCSMRHGSDCNFALGTGKEKLSRINRRSRGRSEFGPARDRGWLREENRSAPEALVRRVRSAHPANSKRR